MYAFNPGYVARRVVSEVQVDEGPLYHLVVYVGVPRDHVVVSVALPPVTIVLGEEMVGVVSSMPIDGAKDAVSTALELRVSTVACSRVVERVDDGELMDQPEKL